MSPGARFSELPVITGPRESFKRFENCAVKLSAKETKWSSSEVRTRPTFLQNLIAGP